jgi:threonine dehydrogenase-like Zn-dependent dehydrogenase
VSPERGGDYLLGGVDVAVDATGTRSGLDTALRSTRAGGRVVLSGMPAAGVDLSPVWFRELDLVGAYASADSEDVAGQRRPAFEIALELAGDPALDGLLSATYPLRRWREAVDHALSAGRLGAVKVAFEMST